MKQQFFTAFFGLLLFTNAVFAQQHPLFFQNYTTANGLCDNTINCITQDSRGFIWIGTSEGLSRFDGISFRNYYGSSDSTKSFTNYRIGVVIEYKPHHLAFVSLGKLWCMNTLNNTFYQPIPSLSNLYFSLISSMPSGDVLLSTNDTIYITDQQWNITNRIASPIKLGPISAFPLEKDTLLITNNREYYLYSISTNKLVPFKLKPAFKENENVSGFLGRTNNNNVYYFGNYWQGLFEFGPDGTLIKQRTNNDVDKQKRLSHNGTNALLQHNDSTIYVGTFSGLNVVNTNTGIVNKYFKQNDHSNSLVGNIIITIFKDRSGNIWIGTTEGLSRLGGNQNVKVIDKVNGRPFEFEFARLSKGNGAYLYASSQGGGTYRINRFNNAIEWIDSTIVTIAWTAMSSGEMTYIAGGGRQKLTGYNNQTGQLSPQRILEPYYGNADMVTLLYRDSHGDEWYSFNQGGGLVRRPAGGNKLEQYSRRLAIPTFLLSYLHIATEDVNGDNWFGVNKSNRLLHWSYQQQKFKEITPDTIPGVKVNSFGGVTCMYADKKGMLWVSYEGTGLLAYDIAKHKGRMYSIEDGLPTNYITSITEDDQQRLWLGTAKGLVCYLPADNKFITFKKESGLPTDDFKGNLGYFDPETKSLWLAGKANILRIDPIGLLNQTKNDFTVYAEEVKVNGKMFHEYAGPSLRHDENNLQFQFTAVDIENGKDLEFAYRLEGADLAYIFAGDKRSAIYSSLAPGKYTFFVRAKRKGEREWIEIKEPFSFTIATPWWQTWWFRSLGMLVLIAIVVAIVRQFFKRRLAKQKVILEKQQAVEKERTRIATDMHDDFGASLSRIKFLSERLQLHKGDDVKTNEDLGKISAFSDEMAEKMGEIVWALNQRYDSSGDMVSFCRSYASEYLGDKNIKLRFESNEKETKMNGEIRRNIFLVIKESLHNIVKHAGASEVYIRIDSGDELNVVIHDNGKGFDSKSIRPFANGIQNMEKRIEEIGGRFTMENVNGTRIEIRVNPGIEQNTYR